MTDTRVMSTHLRRFACIYVRQSTAMQIQRNLESTDRQYGLLGRATELGWPREQIAVIDEDPGLTGSGIAERSGFERMAAEVGLGRFGITLALEVSRLARNNADWYRLLELCGITDTLIGDKPSSSGGCKWSVPAMKLNVPRDSSKRSSPRIISWLVASRPNGKGGSEISPRPSLSGVSSNVLAA